MDTTPSDQPDAPGAPGDVDLLAVLLDEATPAQRALVLAAMAASPAVSARSARLGAMLGSLKTGAERAQDFAVSADQRARLLALAPAPGVAASIASMGERATSAARGVVALLTFDSWRAQVALAGYRAAGQAAERLLRYESEACVVDVRVAPDGGAPGRWWMLCECQGLRLSGARLVPVGAAGAGAPVVCELSGEGYAECAAAAGLHRLELTHDGGLLVIESLRVGALPAPGA
jgi:hypothetical protein